MADRIFYKAEPLSETDRATRADCSSTIKLEASYRRPTIKTNWVRDTAADDSPMGYAQTREMEGITESKFDMTVPIALDMTAMAMAILAEVRRQMANATAQIELSDKRVPWGGA